MEFQKLSASDKAGIQTMSAMASEIVKDYYDDIIGPAMNDYMIPMFQSESAIAGQLNEGYQYYFAKSNDANIGFFAFYPRGEALYLSKFYLYGNQRGKGYGHKILDFLIASAKDLGLKAIELNVNRSNPTVEIYKKMGFVIIREEDNEIGNGFIMDDYVFSLSV